MNNNQSDNNGNSTSHSNHGCLSFLIAIVIIAGVIFGGVKLFDMYSNRDSEGKVANKDGNPVLLERSARFSDITVTESVEATIMNLKETFLVVPHSDIKKLQVTFKFYDDSNTIVKQVTKDVGNVVANSQYTVSISFTLSEIMNISKYSYDVVGGSVSYLSK
ncbi:MAG: hypothetical protein IKP74_05350 [Clostridia bacterium]|nr:hypothetical protein [Clostridia bacterium]